MAFKINFLAALTLGFAGAIPASATVITFDDLAFQSTTSLTTQGYTFDRPSGAPAFLVYPVGIPANADPSGGKTLALINGGGVTLHSADNSAFDLFSLDIAEVQNNINYGLTTAVVFTFTTASGSNSQTYTVDSTPGLQTFLLNQTGLTSFSISSGGGRYVQIDNVNLSGGAATSNVPEPTSWAMMVGGFGLLGGALRTRKRPAARFS